MKNTILLLGLAIVSFACKREVIVEKIVEKPAPADTTAWREVGRLQGERRIMLNSHVFNDSLIGFLNNGEFLVYNAKRLEFVVGDAAPVQSGAFGPGSWDLSKTPTVTDKMLVTIFRNDLLLIAPTASPIGRRPLEFGAAAQDPDFVRYELPSRYDEAIPVVNNKYLLIPYYSKQSTPQKRFCFLAEVDADAPGGPALRSVKRLVFEQSGFGLLNELINVSVVNGHFFVTYAASPTYRVDTTGNIRALNRQFNGFFKVSDLVFAADGSGSLHGSDDQGQNFRPFVQTDDVTWSFMKSVNIGRETVNYVHDIILEMSFAGNTLSWRSLDNTGLERSRITSVNKCGDKVFVTTLNGVFYKHWNNFKTLRRSP